MPPVYPAAARAGEDAGPGMREQHGSEFFFDDVVVPDVQAFCGVFCVYSRHFGGDRAAARSAAAVAFRRVEARGYVDSVAGIPVLTQQALLERHNHLVQLIAKFWDIERDSDGVCRTKLSEEQLVSSAEGR